MSLSLRQFRAKDRARVAEIEAASFPDPWPDSFFKYIWGKAPDLFIVAEESGEILGYVVGELREIMFSGLSHRSKMGHILNIAVDVSRRKAGVGTRLMTEIEGRFREGGCLTGDPGGPGVELDRPRFLPRPWLRRDWEGEGLLSRRGRDNHGQGP